MAIACRPATPAPMMKTFAGAIVPAAVVSIGKNLLPAVAPRRTAAYPATVLKADSESILWASVVRGISSMENAVTPRSARRLSDSAFSCGFS